MRQNKEQSPPRVDEESCYLDPFVHIFIILSHPVINNATSNRQIIRPAQESIATEYCFTAVNGRNLNSYNTVYIKYKQIQYRYIHYYNNSNCLRFTPFPFSIHVAGTIDYFNRPLIEHRFEMA